MVPRRSAPGTASVKQIVVGFDGTGCTSFDDTNVYRILTWAGASHPIVYLPGVGDDWWEKVGGGMNGREMFRRLENALHVVACTWEPGDSIFIVGYSRGGAAAIAFSNQPNTPLSLIHISEPTRPY